MAKSSSERQQNYRHGSTLKSHFHSLLGTSVAYASRTQLKDLVPARSPQNTGMPATTHPGTHDVSALSRIGVYEGLSGGHPGQPHHMEAADGIAA